MILNTIKTSLASLRSNKVRTSLTVLGVVIGISSVIMVYSAGEGVSGLVVGQVESFGTDIIVSEVRIPTSSKSQSEKDAESGVAMIQGVQVTTMKLSDMEDINKLSNVRDSYAGIIGQENISYGNEARKALLFGTNSSYIDIDKSEVGEGRFFTDSEDRSLAKVAVLGSKMKEKLFGDSEAIDKQVQIRKIKFRVIGVMEERGAVFGQDYDDYVYLPIRTLQKRIMGIDHVIYMVHQLYNIGIAEETADEVRFTLRENHDIANEGFGAKEIAKDDFRVTTMEEMMEILDVITGSLTLLLLAIVAISLLVGGVGIMNIMYVSVSERTHEIGLRKAVGAKYTDIMSQFLIESVVITILGGVIGIVIGVLMSYLIAIGASSRGIDWNFNVPLKAFVVALGFSAFFGIVFGLFPARKAARLDPIEALRKE